MSKRSSPRVLDCDFDRMVEHFSLPAPDGDRIDERVWMFRGVIFQALEDMAMPPRKRRDRKPHRDAVEWFFSNDDKIRQNFELICDLAYFDAGAVVHRAKKIISGGNGLRQRAAMGTAKDYARRRARYQKSKFASPEKAVKTAFSMQKEGMLC